MTGDSSQHTQADSSGELCRIILREKTRDLFSALPNSLIISLINACLLVWILGGASDDSFYGWYWLAAMIVVLVFRGLNGWRNARLPDVDVHKAFRSLFLWVFLTALLWGLASVLLFSHSLSYQVFLAFVIAGMASGAVASLSVSLLLLRIYVLLLLLPLMVQFFLVQSPISLVMAFMTLAFGMVLLINGKRLEARYVENIRLRYLSELRQEELGSAQNDLLSIFNGVTEGILVLDLDGRLLKANRSAMQMLGVEESDLFNGVIAKRWAASVDEKLQGPLYWNQVVNQRKSLVFQWILKNPRSGQLFDVELSMRRMHLGQGDVVLVNIHDISESKKVERLKNEFVSTVSHELRTPLTAIRGALGLLQGGKITSQEDSHKLIALADNNAVRLSNLINDILDVEKMAQGKLEFYLSDQILQTLLAQAVENNQVYGVARQISLRLDFQLPQSTLVRVDSERFLQVMANLISNAIKYSPASGEVLIRAGLSEDLVKIEVIDHGEGIPESFQASIFEKFSQADSSATRVRGGTGLGLSIAKGMIEQMGGKIGFVSQPGQGTCFYLLLPKRG